MRRVPLGIQLTGGAILLLATACGGTASVPSSQPASPAGSAPASPAAKPLAAAPAASTAAGASAAQVAKPAIKVAYSAEYDFTSLPLLITSEKLTAMGYKVEAVKIKQPEVAVEALSKGDVQFNSGSTSAAMTAMEKGAKVKLIADRSANEWLIEAPNAIAQCSDLQGKKLAMHSEAAVSTAMANVWLAGKCPQTKPQILMMPGSDVRATALMAGQIDATPLTLSDTIDIDNKAPGKFHQLADFSTDLPKLATTSIYANSDFIAKNRPAVVDFVTQLVATHRAVNANRKLLKDAAQKYNPNLLDNIDKIIDGYLKIKAFDENGGLTPDRITYSIDFFIKSKQIDPGLTLAQAADLTPLDDALAKLGKK